MSEPARLDMLGVWVNRLDVPALYELIERHIAAGGTTVIGNHNLHSVSLHHADPQMRDFYARADYVFIDGMPLVYVGRLLGMELRRDHRMTSVDWFRRLLPRAVEQGWRIFFVGGRQEVADRAAEILRAQAPGLQLEVTHGFFDARPESEENRALVQRIREYRPHLLVVGMGMPRQERWILQELDRLPPCVVMNLGALMDYVAGAVPTPPRWLSRLGFEWLARLATEPRRLASRYLVEPWSLLPHLARDLWTHRSRVSVRPRKD